MGLGTRGTILSTDLLPSSGTVSVESKKFIAWKLIGPKQSALKSELTLQGSVTFEPAADGGVLNEEEDPFCVGQACYARVPGPLSPSAGAFHRDIPLSSSVIPDRVQGCWLHLQRS